MLPIDACVEQAREAVAQLNALCADPRSHVPGERGRAMQALFELEQGLAAARYGLTTAAINDGEWESEGRASAAAWLRDLHNIDHRKATTTSADAQWVTERPVIREALESGQISVEHITRIRPHTQRSEQTVAAFDECLGDIVTIARSKSPSQAAKIIAAYSQALDPLPADEAAARVRDRRSVRLSAVGEGPDSHWVLSATLDPIAGAQIASILEEKCNQLRTKGDERTPAQLRADALLEIFESGAHDLPAGAIARTRVQVLVPIELLSRTPDLPGLGASQRLIDLAATWTASSGPGHDTITPRTLRALTCDTVVSRLVLGPQSEVLDHGRSARTVPSKLRQTLIARDGGCMHPHCDRPPGWAQAHHITHWADGGQTNLDNLILLCQFHHTWLHDNPSKISITPGTRGSRPLVTLRR